MISRYQKRISIPTLRRTMDRIDIHCEVPRVDYDKLTSDRLGEPSEAVRERVEAAWEVQRVRFNGAHSGSTIPGGRRLTCNADMGPAEVRQYCDASSLARGRGGQGAAASAVLHRAAMQQLHMSARAYHRILKLARTIADLAGSAAIQTPHLAPAP
jgi:magnesium chelatase family protein